MKWFWLADILFLVTLGVYVFGGLADAPFHGDESTFVYFSRDYDRLVYEHDLDTVTYHETSGWDHDQWLRILNGSINPLTIGAAWDVAGKSVHNLNGPWEWELPFFTPPGSKTTQWTWNERRGNLPDGELLHIARLPSTLFTVLSVVIVFAIARWVSHSRIAAWIASLVYITTPAILINGRRAMQEGAMLCFSALVILVALYAVQEQRRPNATWATLTGSYMALGVAGGFAAASKHSSAMVLAAAWLALAIAAWPRREATRFPLNRQHFYALMVSGLTSLLVFAALMPVWWYGWSLLGLLGVIVSLLPSTLGLKGNRAWIVGGTGLALALYAWNTAPTLGAKTIGAAAIIMDNRQDLMDIQVERFGGMDGPGDRVKTLVDYAFFAGAQYFEDPAWGAMEQESAEIAAYRDSGVAGRGGGAIWGGALIVMTGLGAVWLWKHRDTNMPILTVCWLVVPAILLLLTNPLPWQRYYIGLHAPLAVLASLGVLQIIAWVHTPSRTPAPEVG